MKRPPVPARGRSALAASTVGLAIVGGTIHPASAPEIREGTVLIVDGKITAVGDVLDFRHVVEAAWLDGRQLDLSDRHKKLYERYRNRPKPGAR